MASLDFIDYNTLLGAGKKAVNSVSSMFGNDSQSNRYDQLQNASAFKEMPSMAAFATMNSMGINPNTQFGQQYAIDVGQRLNNAFKYLGPGSMAGVGDDDTKRAQFMLDYSKALMEGPNNPLFLDYNEVGAQLQQMLAGAPAAFNVADIKSGSAQDQYKGLLDYVNTIGFQSMSAEKFQSMQYQLTTLLSDYSSLLATGQTGGQDFLGYVVSRAADFLDIFFGQRDWSYLSTKNPNGPTTTYPNGGNGSGSGNGSNGGGILRQDNGGGRVTEYYPAYGLPGVPAQRAAGLPIQTIDGKPYYVVNIDPHANDPRTNLPYMSGY